MRWLATILACLCFAGAAVADDEPRYNRVQLQAQQSESVSNDTMHVSLAVYAEHRDPATLAEMLNEDMRWALALVEDYQGVKASSGSYQTWPIHRDNVMKGWRGEQMLLLESIDTDRLSELSGKLQERLQIKSMRFSVSNEKRALVENRLIGDALDAFKARARLVGENLDAKGYRIVDINVGSSSQRPPVMYQRMATAAMEPDSAVSVDAGDSDIDVTVSGTIELVIP